MRLRLVRTRFLAQNSGMVSQPHSSNYNVGNQRKLRGMTSHRAKKGLHAMAEIKIVPREDMCLLVMNVKLFHCYLCFFVPELMYARHDGSHEFCSLQFVSNSAPLFEFFKFNLP